jgi:hypothetical protein
VAGIHRFCRDHDVAMADFVKSQRKDDLAQEYLARFTGEEGVLFVGRAQEKTRVFRTEKRRNPETGPHRLQRIRDRHLLSQLDLLETRPGQAIDVLGPVPRPHIPDSATGKQRLRVAPIV